MNHNCKKYVIFFLGLIGILSSGFHIQEIEDFKDSNLRCRRNYTNDLGECSPAGSALSKIDRIGFWGCYPFSDNKNKQIELLLWMKKRFEEVGHCIILDEVNGIDFTDIAKGGHASMGEEIIRVNDFKTKTSSKLQDIKLIQLEIDVPIIYKESKKRDSVKAWQQYMVVDSSDDENLMLGYKELVNNLISDLQKTNKNYEKYVPVFYITIDTEFKPYLKEVLGKYVSPPLTVIPANER